MWPNVTPHPEPSANARTFANICRDYHLALIGAGFTEDQALAITCTFTQAGVMGAIFNRGDE